MAARISTRCSRFIPLRAGVTWSGEDLVEEFVSASISVFADQNGSLELAWSTEKSNWDRTEVIPVTASTYLEINRDLPARYLRVSFENTSGSDQSELRLQTKYYLSFPESAAVTAEKYEADLELAAGNLADRKSVCVWGAGIAYPTAPTLISSIRTAGDRWIPETLPHYVEVVSDNANDSDGGGSGAQQVTLEGIDAGGSEISEVVSMSGLVVAPASTSWQRVNRAYTSSAGTNMTNLGTITIRKSGGGTTELAIQPNAGESSGLQYRAPSNRRMFLEELSVCSRDQGTWHDIKMYVYTAGVKRMILHVETTDGNEPNSFPLRMMELPAGSEIAVEIETDTGGSLDIWGSIKVLLAP